VTSNDDRRARAYRAGAQIAKDRMGRQTPLDAEALSRIEAADVLVVPGIYDHVEMVLDALETPYTPMEAGGLLSVRLRPEQLVVVNCPGHLARPAVARLREFVAAGGSLFTTDWALRHVLEPAFPGVVAFNERPTRDDVVRIEVREHDNPFLEGVMDGADDPVWWLEGSSYPIRVLERERVDTLITSAELEAKYGETPVAVMFRHGEGEVFHMISHYYLQRTELRNRRHHQPAVAYAAEKGVSLNAARSAEMADLKVGDVESAATSSRFLANVLAARKRRMEGSRRATR
jgi:hypothetical protein